MASQRRRTQDCAPSHAKIRLQQATAMLEVAGLVQHEESDAAHPSVAAALAVLAGVAASDAACCAALHRRPRGQSHIEAAALLESVNPHGGSMAKNLRRLLSAKDSSHYGLALITPRKAADLVEAAQRMCVRAAQVVSLYS